jgi:hypothetical protein
MGENDKTRPQLRGYACGIAILAFFGLAWTSWVMAADVSAPIANSVTAAAALCFLVLLGGAIKIFRRATSFPAGNDTSIRGKRNRPPFRDHRRY